MDGLTHLQSPGDTNGTLTPPMSPKSTPGPFSPGSEGRTPTSSEPNTPSKGSIGGAVKSSGWKNLKPYPLDRKWKEQLPLGPKDRHRHGTLPNGMRYYVQKTHKPKDRAALALAVDVGSIAETEEERGVAHLVEHLAFRATESNDNFAIVKFLESIGAEFGACQNAYTSMDETVYELLVPIDKPNVLEQSLDVFAEFATKIRISDADVNDERGAVMEELRMGRDARGRASEAYWKMLMQGSLYAERLPIGLEKVIREGDPEVFRRFYKKWYRPERMAVVAAGDFENLGAVEKLIKQAFAKCAPAEGQPKENPKVERPLIAPHVEPRITCMVDREATKTSVTVTFKYEASECATPSGFFTKTVEDSFKLALDNRLYKIMRKADPPFFSAACSIEEATRTTTIFSLQIVCEEGKAKQGLEAGLRELTRARLHGFSEQELRIAGAKQLADAEQLFVERDQTYCTSLRDELVGHFLRGEFVVGAEEEARITRACVERVKTSDLKEFAKRLNFNNSCVIRAMEGRALTTEKDIAGAIDTIQREEHAGAITENEMFNVPERLIEEDTLPPPGKIEGERKFPKLGFKIVQLSNGMQVAMKQTDFLDDQVLVRCFARGGLSEVDQKDYLDALYANTIASELGSYGVKPEILADILAGKRCDVAAKTGTYYRKVDGEASPTDIESTLQLIHMLFTSDVKSMLVPEELEAVLRMQEEAIRNRSRDPVSIYNQTIRHLVYGKSFQSQPLRVKDVRKMKPAKACEHFNASFGDPSEFTMVLVGAFDERRVRPMIEKYLGSIQPSPNPKGRVLQVTPAPFKFPRGVVNRDLRVAMVEPMAQASITFPVNIPNPDYNHKTGQATPSLEGSVALTREKLTCVFASSIIERRLLALLRFKFGEIYTCAASTSFAYQDPQARGPYFRGDIMINFSCDPIAGHRLAQLAMEDVGAMQREGPTAEEVTTAVELETRALEVRVQENSYWREYFEALHNSRLSPLMEGDLDQLYQVSERTRKELMDGLTPEMVRAHLLRCVNLKNRVVVVLRPQRPLWQRLLLPSPTTAEGWAVIAGYAGLTVAAVSLYDRYCAKKE